MHSFAGDDWRVCRDHVRDRLGIARDIWKRERAPAPTKREDDDRAKAQWLWGRRKPIAGTIAEIYLREVRGYRGAIPATLGFLPARGDHRPR